MEIGLAISFLFFAYLFFHYFCRIGLKQKKWIQHYLQSQKKKKELTAELPFLLLQLSSYLKAGHALPQALKHMSGNPKGKLLHHFLKLPSEDVQISDLVFLKLCFKLSQKNGISLSPVLVKFSEILRQKNAMHQKLRLLTFPMRAQAVIALCLPWFVLIVFILLDPELIQNSLSDPYGIVGYSTTLILQGGAIWWIKNILR